MKRFGELEILQHIFITLLCFGDKWTASLLGAFRSGGTAPVPII
jgi:hypothetical protein